MQKKTLRKEDEEDKKIKKKNSDLNHKTKTEIDYQIKKKNNPYDLDKIYNDFTCFLSSEIIPAQLFRDIVNSAVAPRIASEQSPHRRDSPSVL